MSAQGPLVSIVVPTFNRADSFLEPALRSVLGQDYESLEVIVCDDGSSDRTPELVEALAREHPARLRSERHDNIGHPATVNRGFFELARGDIVGYLNDDDLLRPTAVSTLVAALADAPDAAAAICAFEVISEGGRWLNEITPREQSVTEILANHDTGIGPGALVRAEAIGAAGPWNTSLRYSYDFDFWVRVALQGRIIAVPEVLSSFRKHSLALTGNGGIEEAREHIRLIDIAYRCDGLPPEALAVRDEAYRSAFVTAACLVFAPDPGSRFSIDDRRAPEVSAEAAAAVAAREHVPGWGRVRSATPRRLRHGAWRAWQRVRARRGRGDPSRGSAR